MFIAICRSEGAITLRVGFNESVYAGVLWFFGSFFERPASVHLRCCLLVCIIGDFCNFNFAFASEMVK